MLEIARLQPRLDLPASREVPESLVDVGMTDAVKRTADIRVQNPSRCRMTIEAVEAGANGIMDTASGAKPITGGFEMSFPGGFQRGLDHMLANAVLDGSDA